MIRSLTALYLRRTLPASPISSVIVRQAPLVNSMAQKRPFNEGKRHFKKNKKVKSEVNIVEGSNEEVLLADVRHLLKISQPQDSQSQVSRSNLPEQGTQLELSISELSSTGDGLAEKEGRVYVVPFTTPGDVVQAKVYKHMFDAPVSLTDFISVTKPSADRTETPKCRYYTQCSGCQFQQLPYAYQLAHKRHVVEKAYRNFSQLSSKDVPTIGETIGSPQQYGYRTKLTPHFDGPPGGRRDRRQGKVPAWETAPPIGFMKKGTRQTMDIEECPIGTESVQRGMTRERARVTKEIGKYQKGVTILLRETTKKCLTSEEQDAETDPDVIWEEKAGELFRKSCITDHNATSTEYIDRFRFDNPAGSFFQNNNSILPLVIKYVSDNILGPKPASNSGAADEALNIKHMIDAYCGSGFFTIALSGIFETSIGIDIAQQSIDYASKNARLNNLPESSTRFIAADANKLFEAIDQKELPPQQTAVVIDPPRKGCDQNFIRQLLAYGPERICYVSCNVHTQARDVGWLVGGLEAEGGSRIPGLYEIESLRGFDFFPQTSHVEGVAFLQKRSATTESGSASSDDVKPVQTLDPAV